MVVSFTLVPSFTGAQTFSLPVEGYFRQGRCMPVEFAGTPPRLFALPSAVPVQIESSTEQIVPVLMLGDLPQSLGQQTFVPLSDREKLVLVIGSDFENVEQIFPDFATKTVRRSASISGPSLAWEAVDALVSDQPIAPQTRDAFLAQGTTLLVTATPKPDNEYPWQPFAGGWILRSIAPDLSSNTSSVYEPTVAWKPAATALARQVLLGITTLAALISLATFLIGSRWRTPVQVAVLGTMLIGLLVLYRSASPAHRKTVRINLFRNGVGQEDRWDYYKTNLPATDVAYGRPVPVDLAHARNCHLTEIVGSAGIQWQFALKPNASLAFVSRLVAPDHTQPSAAESQVPSTFTTMAQSLYGQPNSILEGGAPDEASQETYIRISDR